MDISYKIIGKGEPIVFIHGIGSRKISWDGVINILKNNYQCISYDLRGHGKSIREEKNFSLIDLVGDLEKLRSYLHINKMHIVGHSLGGMIGPYYEKMYTHNVISLSLLSTAAFRSENDQKRILDIIMKIEKKGIDLVLPELIDRWFTDSFIKDNQDIVNRRIKQVKDTPLKTFLNVFKIYALTEMSPWLHEIFKPCLIITGENDKGCSPMINKQISKAIKNSHLKIIKNAKHAITLENPKVIAETIKKFLQNFSKK